MGMVSRKWELPMNLTCPGSGACEWKDFQQRMQLRLSFLFSHGLGTKVMLEPDLDTIHMI